MKIQVIRNCGATCTIGELLIDGKHECWTLEDVVRPVSEKMYGETAIPYGVYDVVITYSPHFQRDLPLLLSVPNFTGVRIHPGNTAADTEGCLLVGTGRNATSVTGSRDAFNALYPKVRDAIRKGEKVTIEYK
jgi:hypothetical protein